MNKKLIISIGIILLTTICLVFVSSFKKDDTESEILGVIVEKNDGMITIQDKENASILCVSQNSPNISGIPLWYLDENNNFVMV